MNSDDKWSKFFDYKGEVDFKDDLLLEVLSKMGAVYDNIPSHIIWQSVKRYRIKLDGVIIKKYDRYTKPRYEFTSINEFINEMHVIGHDPHNKIIIIKDKE